MSYVKKEFPAINQVEYFSDGCAGQYKNYKNILNLCRHQSDFGIKANWSFFLQQLMESPHAMALVGLLNDQLHEQAYNAYIITGFCQLIQCWTIAYIMHRVSSLSLFQKKNGVSSKRTT